MRGVAVLLVVVVTVSGCGGRPPNPARLQLTRDNAVCDQIKDLSIRWPCYRKAAKRYAERWRP